jgi:hypothetical protein
MIFNKLDDFFEKSDFSLITHSWRGVDYISPYNQKYKMLWNHLFDAPSTDYWTPSQGGKLNQEKWEHAFPFLKNKTEYLKNKFISAKTKKTLYVISDNRVFDFETIVNIRNSLTNIREGNKEFVLLFVSKTNDFVDFENIVIRKDENLWPWEDIFRKSFFNWEKILKEFKFSSDIWD